MFGQAVGSELPADHLDGAGVVDERVGRRLHHAEALPYGPVAVCQGCSSA